jgi:HEAT repeat protein
VIDELLRTLVHSTNPAADDVLVDALRLGTVVEQRVILGAILARKAVPSMCGVIEQYEKLPESLQLEVLQSIGEFHSALREAGRSENAAQRLGAIKLIAIGRQGKLCYVLSENLHSGDDRYADTAAGALTSLSLWVWRGMRQLQWGQLDEAPSDAAAGSTPLVSADADLALSPARVALHKELTAHRAEIEQTLVRALQLHRGQRQQELLGAALMLCDSAQSGAMRILTTAKHGGQTPMLRRIQQVPEPEHVAAFLLGATHGGLRATFGVTFAKVDSAPALDQFLRRTHWLKDNALQLCTRQITGGAWCGEMDLPLELARRTPKQIGLIAEWIVASGLNEQQVESRLDRAYAACGDDFEARLRVARVATSAGPRAGNFVRKLLTDSDERIVRIAARDLIRRRSRESESALLPLMSDAPASVRRIVSRAIGHSSFETFWTRFDLMDVPVRKNAGRALLKMLPDAVTRLQRRLSSGDVEHRVKAMQIALELDLIPQLRSQLLPLCQHPHVRVRSKAVTLLGEIGIPAADVLIEKAVNDADARVRANAIEAMEQRGNGTKFVNVLSERARIGANRERANAIKALHNMKLGVAGPHLEEMLRDDRPEHRVSALWLLRRIGWWKLLAEVARVARDDGNLRVRRYAMSVLQTATVQLKSA